MLKELGCRLKSLVYQKNEVSRKDILDMFRKSEVHLGKRKPKNSKFGSLKTCVDLPLLLRE